MSCRHKLGVLQTARRHRASPASCSGPVTLTLYGLCHPWRCSSSVGFLFQLRVQTGLRSWQRLWLGFSFPFQRWMLNAPMGGLATSAS